MVNMKTKAEKLFGVLVLGGAMIASAEEPRALQNGDGENLPCHLAVSSTKYWPGGASCPEKTDTVCIDRMSDQEILEVVQKAREENPLGGCGCWNG